MSCQEKLDHINTRGRTETVTNSLNHITRINYFDDTRRKVELIYPNLDKVTYRYDVRRLLENVTDERGKITAYEFDNAYRLKKITDPLNHVKEFGYDLMSNMTSYKDPLGHITKYTPDDFNRLKEIEYPPATANPYKEKFEYDKIGRIKKYYDDPANPNRFTEYNYNDANLTYTVINAELEATQIKYNKGFQMIEVKDAINQVYQFTHDPLGRILSQTRAGSTMSFEYDEVGNSKKRIDYSGRVTHYTHDKLNRLEKIVYGDPVPAGAPPNLQATYGYDDISRLTSAVNEAGTVSFTYDTRNRIETTTDVFGHTLRYEYELTPLVNQRRLKLDGAMYAVYNFDDANRLLNLVNSADGSTISFGYDNEDKLTSRNYPNGVVTTYEFDDMDRLKRLKDAGPSGTLFDRQYLYNTASQISDIIESAQTRTFGYDNVDRLTSVINSSGQNESYAFDDVGNRTTSHRSATYGYQPFNRLTSTATSSYRYDSNGSMYSRWDGPKRWTQMWDYENRLTKLTNQKQTVRYLYDALGRCVQRYTVGNKENTKFTYDGDDVLLDDNGGTLTKYQNGLGIDNKLQQTTGSATSYFLADHLGSTNGIADSTGSLTALTGYDSFGNATNDNFPSRYQFTGREYDSLTKLHYYRARFYDANLGRFISEDPIGFGGGDVNLYGYVWNNPAGFTDPSGNYPFTNYGAKTPAELADILDRGLDSAQSACGCDVPIAYDPLNPFQPRTLFGTLRGFTNLLRIGNGLGHALYAPDENGWGRCAFIAMDIERGAGLFTTMAGPFAGSVGRGVAADVPASAPVGTSRSPMQVGVPGGWPTNAPGAINGRPYSGHAIDRMQGRGIPPSVVENTIQNGVPSAGNRSGTTAYYDRMNNITVVSATNNGTVITVRYGRP